MNTPRSARPFATALLALTALTSACGARTHLTDSHGRAMRAAFANQAVNPDAGERPQKLPGLDAQEAAIVVKNYRRSLAAKATPNDDQGMVIMAPPAHNQQPYLPPPSVPQERR